MTPVLLTLRIALLASISVLPLTAVPTAVAEPCPDVDIAFARGSNEPAGLGGTGQTFVNALTSDIGGAKTVTVYPVNYPATMDYPSALAGEADAANHVREMAARCPGTKMVLGGFSQGAGVMALLTANGATAGPAVADRVAAVALFGKPSANLLNSMQIPPLVIGPLYANKTIDLCNDGDPVCSGEVGSNNVITHLLYGVNGMVSQAADFAARRV